MHIHSSEVLPLDLAGCIHVYVRIMCFLWNEVDTCGIWHCICFLLVAETGTLLTAISTGLPEIRTYCVCKVGYSFEGQRSLSREQSDQIETRLLKVWIWFGCPIFAQRGLNQLVHKENLFFLVEFCFVFCLCPFSSSRCTTALRVTPWFSVPPLLLFHFLPMNGRTEITLVKSMALQGENPLCQNKWKTRSPQLKGTLRDLQLRCFTGLSPQSQTRLITPADCMESG